MLKKADLTALQARQFEDYLQFLITYNQNVNLTAITEPEEIRVKHFEDSLALLDLVDFAPESSLIDVGSGAGFPGIPLLIARPDLKVTLLDSLNKRVVFLQQLCARLDISPDGILHDRAEEAGRRAGLRESFDFAAARAVAELSALCEYCLPFVKTGGRFLAMKGPDCGREVQSAQKAVSLLGGTVEQVLDYKVGGNSRTLVVIRKTGKTPERYPRHAAKMAKNPL